MIPDLGGDHHALVEAFERDHLRHAGRRDDSGTGESVHLDRIAPCARSRDFVARRRRIAEHSVGPGRGKLQRVLARPRHAAADGRGLRLSTLGLASLMVAPAVFAFGLVAFGFLGMGPVTIAVDSYGPVTDNAQSVYELSLIEDIPGHQAGTASRSSASTPDFERAKENLEENDGAGNTFKATAKPVLIGTAVVGATTMIFSIIVAAHQRADAESGEAFDSVSAVPAGPDGRRRDHLLVHRRVHAGGDDGRLPRGRIHQEEHQAGRRDQGLGGRTAKRWSRSARSTRRRACSISSWRCSSRRWRSRSPSRSCLSAI